MVAHYQAAVGGFCSGTSSAVATCLSVQGKKGGLSSLDWSHSASVQTSPLLASKAFTHRAIFHPEHSTLKLVDWQWGEIYYIDT